MTGLMDREVELIEQGNLAVGDERQRRYSGGDRDGKAAPPVGA